MISTDNKNASEYFKNYRNFGRISLELGYDIESDGFKFYMNNLNATIALTQIKRYEENLKVRKLNYLTLQKKYNLLPHDDKSSFYFATTLTENANHIIAERSLTRNYPMLHKMSYYKSNQRLPRLEKIHHKILNLPLWNIGEIE
jgi:dTDP-4-amino-4,6-dideoxygalactose transaminase